MLRKKNILIWAVAVTFCFAGAASALTLNYGKASPTLSQARYYDEAYVMIDYYVDGNGDTWILWLDCRYGTTQLEIVAAVDTFLQIDGVPEESVEAGGRVSTESIGTWPTPETPWPIP
jgi:hypothetical protein